MLVEAKNVDSRTVDETLATYISTALSRPLPDATITRARMHLLDTLVAIISGRTLPPGEIAYRFAERLGGPPEATLIGSDIKVSLAHAALANGMAGHADETDDSHLMGRFHPGCGIVPVALNVTEGVDRSFGDVLRAIVLGYDIGARATMALGYTSSKTARFSTHTLGTQFGSAATAGALLGLDATQCAAMLSFAVQQASGLPYWNKDPDHIEKAFDFGGKGARDGVYAALMADAGMTAPPNPMTCDRGYLDAFAANPDPLALIDGLGARFEIDRASLKKWCVGSPIQSMLDGLEFLRAEHPFSADDVVRLDIIMPSDRYHIVNDSSISTICMQHLAALMLVQGTVAFDAAHDEALMDDPAIRAVRDRITLSPDDDLAAAVPARQSIVELRMKDGRTMRRHTKAVHGTPDNPMTEADAAQKAREILLPIIPATAEALIDACLYKSDTDVPVLLGLCRLPGSTS